MTLKMMAEFGAIVRFKENEITIKPQTYKPIRYKVESDWSAASYWYEILSILGKGEIFLKGLYENSFQGDSKVAVLFEQLGVKTEYQSEGVLITATKNYVSAFEYRFR